MFPLWLFYIAYLSRIVYKTLRQKKKKKNEYKIKILTVLQE